MLQSTMPCRLLHLQAQQQPIPLLLHHHAAQHELLPGKPAARLLERASLLLRLLERRPPPPLLGHADVCVCPHALACLRCWVLTYAWQATAAPQQLLLHMHGPHIAAARIACMPTPSSILQNLPRLPCKPTPWRRLVLRPQPAPNVTLFAPPSAQALAALNSWPLTGMHTLIWIQLASVAMMVPRLRPLCQARAASGAACC